MTRNSCRGITVRLIKMQTTRKINFSNIDGEYNFSLKRTLRVLTLEGKIRHT